MSTPESKPETKRMLNRKLLPVAAILLIALALLFMATPLLRMRKGFQGTVGVIRQENGQSYPPNITSGLGNAPQFFSDPGSGSQGQTFSGPGSMSQGQGFPGQIGTNFPNRRFIGGIGFLSGRSAPIIYFVALLVAIIAALGMFFSRRWGQVLGIFMAMLYLVAGGLSLLPLLLMSSFGLRNPLNLILGSAHVVLALAVIVLASIPGKKVIVPTETTPLPAASM